MWILLTIACLGSGAKGTDGDGETPRVADELCNGLDDDGDGAIDEDAVDAVDLWVDADGDGFGSGSPHAPVLWRSRVRRERRRLR